MTLRYLSTGCLLRTGLRSDIENDPAVDLPLLEPVENVVDRRQWLLLDSRLHLAVGGKLQSLLKVLAGAHNRTPYGLAVKHQIENRDREFAGRQAVQDTGPATAQRSERLFECRKRHSC